jgi:hypothetical protein
MHVVILYKAKVIFEKSVWHLSKFLLIINYKFCQEILYFVLTDQKIKKFEL